MYYENGENAKTQEVYDNYHKNLNWKAKTYPINLW